MITLAFPEPDFRVREDGGKHYIFDNIRSRWLLLTEEEWVRQNIVSYLLKVARYPKSLIALEKEISVNELKKRFDVLVYDRNLNPWMLIECKAPDVMLSESVLMQALHYNITMPARYIVITNGKATAVWEKSGNQMVLMKEFPAGEAFNG